MSLVFRLLRILLGYKRRPAVRLLEQTRLTFRVWPTDLDYLWHMNNGKYFGLMDLGRMDMLLRSGIFRAMRQHGWYGVVASETIRFRQSLQLWQRFELHTDTLGWDDRSIYLRQTFVRNDAVIAIAIVRARFLARDKGALTATDVVNAVAPGVHSPPIPEYVREWQQAERGYSVSP